MDDDKLVEQLRTYAGLKTYAGWQTGAALAEAADRIEVLSGSLAQARVEADLALEQQDALATALERQSARLSAESALADLLGEALGGLLRVIPGATMRDLQLERYGAADAALKAWKAAR